MRTRSQWHRHRSSTAARRYAGLRMESLEQRTLLAANIVVSEINYFPAEPTAAELDALGDIEASDFDFLEIYNADDVTVDLEGYEFTRGVSFVFPQVSIDPGQFAVIVKNQSAFRFRYGDEPFVIGQFTSGQLRDDGERIELVDQLDDDLVDFSYETSRPWPESPDGHGATLELIDPDNTPGNELDEFFHWRGSTEFGGSPGVRGAGPIGVIVNEILTHTDAPITLPDSIELFNSTAEPIDVSGWFLSDSFNSPLRFLIPNGTIIEPKDYVVFDETHFNPTPENPGPNDFGLSGAHGDEVILTIPDPQGEKIAAFVDAVNFGAAANGESFGRLPNGTGNLGPLSHNSFGCDNTAARVGPVVITEINYNPADPIPAAVALFPDLSKSRVEYIEIHNPTSEPVDLTNWRIRGDVAFDFVADEMLAPGETVLVLRLDPSNPTQEEAFRVNYGLPPGQRFMGPWSGSLGNVGGRVELQHPDEPPLEEPDFFPRLIQDIVVYDDRAPWPESPDGNGDTLQRLAPFLYGSDSVAWVGAAPSIGDVTFQDPAVTGDFDGDGLITGTDVELLRDFVRSEVQIEEYDVNGDVVVNFDDVNHLVFNIAESRSGDANFDGLVDARDYNAWHALINRPCGNLSSGDFNGDQFIDESDFALWSVNRFTGMPRGHDVPSNRTPRAPLGNRVSVQLLPEPSQPGQPSDAGADNAMQSLASAVSNRSNLAFAPPRTVAAEDSRLRLSPRKLALVDGSVDEVFATASTDYQVSWFPLFEQDFRNRRLR